MSRYIDADAFETFGYKVSGGSDDFKDGFDEGVQFVLECIDNVPTADVVEIVRCKNCEHYAGDGMYCSWDIITHDNGFCHHGEHGEIH